jgi:hypothetical protein
MVPGPFEPFLSTVSQDPAVILYAPSGTGNHCVGSGPARWGYLCEKSEDGCRALNVVVATQHTVAVLVQKRVRVRRQEILELRIRDGYFFALDAESGR